MTIHLGDLVFPASISITILRRGNVWSQILTQNCEAYSRKYFVILLKFECTCIELCVFFSLSGDRSWEWPRGTLAVGSDYKGDSSQWRKQKIGNLSSTLTTHFVSDIHAIYRSIAIARAFTLFTVFLYFFVWLFYSLSYFV